MDAANRFGERFLRWLDRYFGRHSAVGDTTFFDPADVGKFDWVIIAAGRAPDVAALGLDVAGIELTEPDALVQFSRWITPAQVKIRFDTWFFLAPAPDDAEAVIDGAEIVDARWYSPAAALAASAKGELFLVFPTIKHLEQLARFTSVDELLDYARDREVEPVEPRVVLGGETARIVLPGDPGYEH